MDAAKFTSVHMEDDIDEFDDLDDFDSDLDELDDFGTITLADGTTYLMATLIPGTPNYIRVMKEIVGK